MGKMKQKLSMVIIITLVFSLTACGKATNTNSNDEETVSENNTGTSTEVEQSTDNEDDVEELNIFINHSWWLSDSWTGIIPEEITKRTGVKLNVTLAADDNQLGLMIASNELPDLIFTANETDRLSSSDFCYPLNELSAEYGIDFEADEERIGIAKSFSQDDNYYTILDEYGTEEEWANAKVGLPGQSVIFYRQDLYEDMGNPAMTTMDEFADVLSMAKEKYSGMLPLAMNVNDKMTSLATWSGSGNVQKLLTNDKDGNATFMITKPEYYNYLKYANSLAQKGLISAENYVTTVEAEARALAFNGDCFAFSWFSSPGFIGQLNNETQKVDPNAKWSLLEPLSDEPYYNAAKGWSGLFISKNCSNPEAAMKFVAFMYSEEGRHLQEWGREGIDYTMGDDGIPVFSDDWVSLLSDETAHIKKYNYYQYYGITAIDEAYQRYASIDPNILSIFSKYKDNTVNCPELAIATPIFGTEEKVIYDKLEELVKSYEGSIIFSESDSVFEKNYANLIQAAQQIGVDDFNEWYNNKVQTIKSEYGF